MKVLAIGGLIVVVALAAVMLLGGAQHGPGLHAPSAGAGSQASPSVGSVAVVGVPNSITLQPGETKALTWRFGKAGALEYACHEPGHYDGGMRGELKVG